MNLVERAALVRQTYGIAGAQTTYGGPRGIWLECGGCPASRVIVGSRYADEPMGTLTDAEAALVFRRYGWTGVGDKMVQARCPACSAAQECSQC